MYQVADPPKLVAISQNRLIDMMIRKYYSLEKEEMIPLRRQTITERQRARALQTLDALSAILRDSAPLRQHDQDCRSLTEQEHPPTTRNNTNATAPDSILSEPYIDPNSVLNIRGQETLEYALLSRQTDDDSCNGTTTTSGSRSQRVVRFCNFVSVHEIPSHQDMDPQIIDCIWTRHEAIQHNAQRNIMEWKWDGQDTTNATEEDEMIHGHIHPATWESMQLERKKESFLSQAKRQEMMRRERYYRSKLTSTKSFQATSGNVHSKTLSGGNDSPGCESLVANDLSNAAQASPQEMSSDNFWPLINPATGVEEPHISEYFDNLSPEADLPQSHSQLVSSETKKKGHRRNPNVSLTQRDFETITGSTWDEEQSRFLGHALEQDRYRSPRAMLREIVRTERCRSANNSSFVESIPRSSGCKKQEKEEQKGIVAALPKGSIKKEAKREKKKTRRSWIGSTINAIKVLIRGLLIVLLVVGWYVVLCSPILC